MRGELNVAMHNDCTLRDISYDSRERKREARTAVVQFATCHPVLMSRRTYMYNIYVYTYIYVYVFVRAYMRIYLSDSEQGSVHRGLAVAGYIGGCGVNNTSRSSYIGDSPALHR